MPALNKTCDLAVIGSGFGGSLMAMIARKMGRSVTLIERGQHPRFAIGESSTPLANLILEQLARRHDLPAVLPLVNFGSWQKTFPGIGCGLKRGFSFYHHQPGRAWNHRPDRANQFLVAASPNNRVADTQWYRPDFDQHLVQAAQEMGVDYMDRTQLETFKHGAEGNWLTGQRGGDPVTVRARFVVDASGPRGCLHQLLGLGEETFTHLPSTQALFAHFTGVKRWEHSHPESSPPPYPVDDAAVHHVFPGGWVWVLRFNNGKVSAGIAARGSQAAEFSQGEPGWKKILQTLPSVAALFENSSVASPFVHLPRLSFRASQITGPGWALLPATAGFVDPLLSTGFTLNLMGIARLSEWMEQGLDTQPDPGDYAQRTGEELDRAALLIASLYAWMDDFDVFCALTKLYFAAVSFAETECRIRQTNPAHGGFLLPGHESFGLGLRDCCQEALALAGKPSPARIHQRQRLLELITQTIDPVDVAGLNRPDRRSWYPVDFDDLIASRHKMGVDEAEIRRMMQTCLA